MSLSNRAKLEDYLKKKVYPDLEKGRPNFDKPHTIEVVSYLKRIIKHTPGIKVDRDVLIIAAYTHDWGYSGLFKNKKVLDIKDVNKAKKQHMAEGAKKLAKLLNDNFFSFLTKRQKQRCVRLVAVHDKIDELKDIDEIVLMEADMLSGLDVNSTKPTFDFKSNQKFIHSVTTTRIPKFVNQYSKKEAKRLIQARINFYKKK